MYMKDFVQNALSIATLLLSFMFVGCGMKNVIALAPARVSSDSPSQWVRIEHNTANQVNSFKGYDVYYKFYKVGDSSKVNSDNDYLTDSTRIPSRNVLTTKKFMLVQRFKQSSENPVDTQTPHIKPNNKKLKEFHTVYIDFSAGNTTYRPLRDNGDTSKVKNSAYISQDGQHYNVLFVRYDNDKVKSIEYLKRDTNPPKNFFKSTNLQYSTNDDDIKDMIGSSFNRASDTKLSIVFAIIPYGIDFAEAKISYGPIVLTKPLEFDYQSTP